MAQPKLTAESPQPQCSQFAPPARAAHRENRGPAENKQLSLNLQNWAIYLEFWGCLFIPAYPSWLLTMMTEMK